jgi:hypothetical protein
MKTVVSLSSPAAKKKKKNKKKILVAPLPGATDYQATTERTQLATAPSKQIENQLPSLNQFAAWVLILVGAVAVLMVVYWCFSFLKKKKRAMSSSSQPASVSALSAAFITATTASVDHATTTNRIHTATVSRTHIDKKLDLRSIVLQHERLRSFLLLQKSLRSLLLQQFSIDKFGLKAFDKCLDVNNQFELLFNIKSAVPSQIKNDFIE